MIMALDQTFHAHQFIFSFLLHFLFIQCELSWLSVSFLLHVNYTVSYRTLQILIRKLPLPVATFYAWCEWCKCHWHDKHLLYTTLSVNKVCSKCLFKRYVGISRLSCNVFAVDSVEPSCWMYAVLVADTR